MAKKFGKLAVLGVLAGAVAGTCYYYYQNKSKKSDYATDDSDDFDDFDDDFEDEDFPSESEEENTSSKARSHRQIDFDLDNAKEKIGGKVIETLDKTKEKIEQFNVSEKLDKAKEFIGEKISPASSEPEYTEMDITSSQETAEEASDVSNQTPETTQSAAYSEDGTESK